MKQVFYFHFSAEFCERHRSECSQSYRSGLVYLCSAFPLRCFCVYSHHLLFCILGWRIGKGEGYADMEYAMMVSMGAVREDTPVITIVHDCQVRLKHPLSSDGLELGDAERCV